MWDGSNTDHGPGVDPAVDDAVQGRTDDLLFIQHGPECSHHTLVIRQHARVEVEDAQAGNRDGLVLENPSIADRNDQVRREPSHQFEPGYAVWIGQRSCIEKRLRESTGLPKLAAESGIDRRQLQQVARSIQARRQIPGKEGHVIVLRHRRDHALQRMQAGQVVVAEEYDLQRDLTLPIRVWQTGPDCNGLLIEIRSEAQHTANSIFADREQR
jgi:hypothetical protein